MTGNRRIRGTDGKPVINDIFPTHYSTAKPGDTGQAGKKTKKPEKVTEQVKADPPAKPEKKPDSRLLEGMRLFSQRHWEQAMQELLLVNASNYDADEQAELAYYLGLCCAKLERFDDALLYLEQVIAAGGDVLRVYQCRLTIAYIYAKTARPKMAEYELKRLQSAGFESVSLYNTLAYASYAQKHYRHAIDFYEKTLELDRNNATALNSMGFILADTGMDPAKGLRLCRKAVDINPQSAVYLDSLGWAHYKCGDIIDARNWLRRANELAPQEKEIEEHYTIVSGEAV